MLQHDKSSITSGGMSDGRKGGDWEGFVMTVFICYL